MINQKKGNLKAKRQKEVRGEVLKKDWKNFKCAKAKRSKGEGVLRMHKGKEVGKIVFKKTVGL